jgi:hypothetical protein
MAFLGLLLLLALMIPIMGLVLDSPVGKALARRLEGPQAAPPTVVELARKLELLENEVDELQRAVTTLQEENQFLQRLLEDQPGRTTLPKPKS